MCAQHLLFFSLFSAKQLVHHAIRHSCTFIVASLSIQLLVVVVVISLLGFLGTCQDPRHRGSRADLLHHAAAGGSLMQGRELVGLQVDASQVQHRLMRHNQHADGTPQR